jgi:hypothetical protein
MPGENNVRVAKMTLIGAILLTSAACGDGGSGPEPSELAGTWHATKVEFVSMADPGQRIELVSLGGTVTMTLAEASTFRIDASTPGEPMETTTGSWSASRDVLTFHWLEGPFTHEWQFDMTLSGNTLTLSGAHDSFDFDDNGVDEDAFLNVVLVRQ